jgi:hypothetical protein
VISFRKSKADGLYIVLPREIASILPPGRVYDDYQALLTIRYKCKLFAVDNTAMYPVQ